MASIWRSKEVQFHDDAGDPLNAGEIQFYTTGTSTPKDTYSNEGLSVANTNPIVLDADGRSANNIWISGRYRVVVKTSAGVTIADIDPVEDSVAASDFQDGSQIWGGTAGGSATALTFTLTPAITAYTDGMEVGWRWNADTTGATTINVNGLGAKSLVKRDGAAIAAGDGQQNDVAAAKFNSTQDRFELVTPEGMLYRNGGNEPARADITDGATLNLTPATVNSRYIRAITSTTTVTAVTLPDGCECEVLFNTARTLTHGASLILPGAADITTVAGDIARFRGEASSVVRCVDYQRGPGIAGATAVGTYKPVIVLGCGGGQIVPADTTEDTLATVTIPANAMGANGTLRIRTFWRANNDASAKTGRVRFSGGAGTVIQTSLVTSTTGTHAESTLSNRNATNVQSVSGWLFDVAGGTLSGGTVVIGGSVDTTAETTLVFTGQKADSTDTLSLDHYSVELLPS